MASWLSGNAFVSGAEGLRFKFRAGQIGHTVTHGVSAATSLRKELYCPGAMTWRWGPPTRYTLRRITANITKDLILLNINYEACSRLKVCIYLDCQVGITSQKTEGARHILPPSMSDPRGRRLLASPKLTPVCTSSSHYPEFREIYRFF